MRCFLRESVPNVDNTMMLPTQRFVIVLLVSVTRFLDGQPTFDADSQDSQVLCECPQNCDGHLQDESMLDDLIRTRDVLTREVAELRARPTVPVLLHSWSGNTKVTALAVLGDRLFVARHSTYYVSIYSTRSFQFQFMSNLWITGLGAGVHGLAACPTNNYLYVSDWGKKCIHRVDLASNSTIKWNGPGNPCGLSINSARNVLAVYCYLRKVLEYTPDGVLVREIPIASPGTDLFHAVELNGGTLAVSNYTPNSRGCSIFTVSPDTGSARGNFAIPDGAARDCYPSGLARDNYGHLFVADSAKRRVLVVNPSLTEARRLPLPLVQQQRARAIAYDQSRGLLFVGEEEEDNYAVDRVLVFGNVFNVSGLF